MGNQSGHQASTSGGKTNLSSLPGQDLASTEFVPEEVVQDRLDENLMQLLGQFLLSGQPQDGSSSLDEKQLKANLQKLYELDTENFIRVVLLNSESHVQFHQNDTPKQDVAQIFKSCANVSGVTFGASDEKFIGNLMAKTTQSSDNNELARWLATRFPKAMATLVASIRLSFSSANSSKHASKFVLPKSDVLSAFQLFLLCHSMPHAYLKTIPEFWQLLYSSDKDGLSVTRFELKVTGYREPTIMLIRSLDGGIYVLCNDEEWKQNQFQEIGQSGACFIQLQPQFSAHSSCMHRFRFDTKSKGQPWSISVNCCSPKTPPAFTVARDFSNIASIEVWGCGEAASLKAQQEQKKWEMRQVEKQQKVPLPGNWDENPDKLLLEMAGIRMGSNQEQ